MLHKHSDSDQLYHISYRKMDFFVIDELVLLADILPEAPSPDAEGAEGVLSVAGRGSE